MMSEENDEIKCTDGIFGAMRREGINPHAPISTSDVVKAFENFVKNCPPPSERLELIVSGATMLNVSDENFVMLCNTEGLRVMCGIDQYDAIVERCKKLGINYE